MQQAPVVNSINRSGTSPTNTTGNVSWTVQFSEDVTGVDTTDFALAASGVVGAGRHRTRHRLTLT